MEKTLFKHLLAVISQYRIRFILAIALVCLSNALLILNPFIFRAAIKNTLEGSQDISGAFPIEKFSFVPVLLCIALTSAFLKYRMRIQFVSISRNAEEIFREKLYLKLQSQSRQFFDNHSLGDLINRLSSDISTYREMLGPGLMYPIFALTMMLPAAFSLFFLSKWLFLFSLLPLLVLLLINIASRESLYSLSLSSQQILSKMSVLAEETYSGVRIFKAYDFKKIGERLFSSLGLEHSSLRRKLFLRQGMVHPVFILILQGASASTAFLFSVLSSSSFHAVSTQDFLTFIWLQNYLFMPVMMLGWIFPLYQQGKAAYTRLKDLYEEPIEVSDTGTKEDLSGRADIFLKNLTFTFSGSHSPSLRDITLTIKEGERIGVAGSVGSGKSTLLKLIQREYDVGENMFFIGKDEVHELKLSALYRLMATCEQIPFLFSDTVSENIRFGREDASKEEIFSVASSVDLHDEIEGFPEKYDTTVGERGHMVSTGQKQRIAVARSLIASKRILILDDIFANVDADKEKKMLERLIEDFKGATIILVTNRVSALEKMDKVIFLQDGKIIEEGSPSLLKTSGGPYSVLYDLNRIYLRGGEKP